MGRYQPFKAAGDELIYGADDGGVLDEATPFHSVVEIPSAFKDDPEGWVRENFHQLKQNFPLYAAINLKITTKRGNVVPFLFNRMQSRLWALLLEDFEARRPVRWFIIKARQLGTSTWVTSLFYWLVSLRSNVNAALICHDGASAEMLSTNLQGLYSRSLPQLQPSVKMMNRSGIHFAARPQDVRRGEGFGLNSRITNYTADAQALGRSYTYHYVLCSEFAIWPDLNIDIKERLVSLNQAIPELPGTIVVLESTAKGDNAAKAFWEDKQNGFKKIFISWVVEDQYRRELTSEEILSFEPSELEETRYGNEFSEKERVRKQLRFWYPEESQSEGWLEKETLCRLAWRRDCIDQKCMGDRNRFKSEYPTSPEDAFAVTGVSVFDQRDLIELREDVGDRLKATRYRYDHDHSEVDPRRKFFYAKYGPLRVYKDPEPNGLYVIGGDAAQGILNTGDHSSLVVLKVPELEEVAYYSEIVTPDIFAGIANYLGLLFNKALLGIENNEKGGFATLQELESRYVYPRLHRRFQGTSRVLLGFHTNDITKSVMVTDTNGLLKNREIIIRSKMIFDQLAAYSILKTGKFGAKSGHDDLVMALMIAVQLASQVHIQGVRRERAPIGSLNWYESQLPEGRRRRGR